ncbi:MAG TPA: TIGR03435 family protein [Bryobacteraceae bacterium]|nr:TIGR03435 family protein [Bryobacteraceae bacterium]
MYKRLFLGAAFASLSLFAQSLAVTPPLAFEVASIKPSPPLDPAKMMGGKMHIGMQVDGARVDIGFLSLADLIRIAYSIKSHQLSGPDWMSSQRYDIMAKMPEGATREQVPAMLQALLAERFKLTVHHDNKESSVYALVVGKNGPKMKEAEPDPEPAPGDAPPPEPKQQQSGFVVNAGGNQMRVTPGPGAGGGPGEGRAVTIGGGPMGQMRMSMAEGAMHMEFAKMAMPAFAEMLARFTDHPVIDMTDLKGKYQVALDVPMEDLKYMARASGAGMMMMGPPGASPAGGAPSQGPADAASAPSGGSIFSAVQKLGLKLEPRKAPVDMIVVDHIEKSPTDN